MARTLSVSTPSRLSTMTQISTVRRADLDVAVIDVDRVGGPGDIIAEKPNVDAAQHSAGNCADR